MAMLKLKYGSDKRAKPHCKNTPLQVRLLYVGVLLSSNVKASKVKTFITKICTLEHDKHNLLAQSNAIQCNTSAINFYKAYTSLVGTLHGSHHHDCECVNG